MSNDNLKIAEIAKDLTCKCLELKEFISYERNFDTLNLESSETNNELKRISNVFNFFYDAVSEKIQK